ncbi:hypothetical protein [Thalassotalea sp. G2M2-11]|uniref:hypothetical protein n=1 Tax=Thalassotalea sp. G2M2-11 TaxID=2787627 RepID=UPI0019D1AA13|nr:hypothetical protein [Thalassotalea sp. G2M2-11]
MKKLLLTLSLVLSASSAQAISDNAEFYTVDASTDSQLCFTAATKGYQAALDQGKEFGGKYTHFTKNTQCNGMTIKAFAKAYYQTSEQADTSTVSLYPANRTHESQLCLQAVKSGLAAVKKVTNISNLKCNGVDIKQFVRQFKDS